MSALNSLTFDSYGSYGVDAVWRLCSSHVLTSDINISQTAQAAELFLSDGVIVTGPETGSPVDAAQLTGPSNAVILMSPQSRFISSFQLRQSVYYFDNQTHFNLADITNYGNCSF